jgi:iron complex transport system ATP-binding protein
MREETIRLQSLAIGYRTKKSTKVVASNLTTTIYSGELTCLLGANGVGKSTLLRTLSAFQPRLEGDITIMGRSIDKYSDRRISHTLGVVLTERCDIRNMSVHDLIGMGRSPYTGFWGRLRNEDRTIVRNAIEMIRIEALADRMVHTLLLHKLTRSTGKTIFLSTHDLELALQIADKIWLMNKEKGIHTGIPEDMALNGQLNRFINREGIVFDIDSGLYRIKNQYTQQIRLTGEGPKYAMMRKALRRNGIYANKEITSDIRIETGTTDSPEFSIRLPDDRKYTVNTIEEVLALLCGIGK